MDVTEDERTDKVPHSPQSPGGSTLGGILRDLFKDALDLIQSEVKLTASEMSWKISQERKKLQLVKIGASVAYAGFLLILTSVVIALSALMPSVWAALIVGVAVLLTGTIAIRIGRKKHGDEDFIPRQTINTLREDAKWMRDQLM